MKKKKRSTFILLFIFFLGLSVLLYPSISSYWNRKTQTEVIVDYESMLERIPEADYTELFQAADSYNEALHALAFPLIEADSLPDYDAILNPNGNGIMGYVTIKKIGVELPVYHGTSDAVLSAAVGHLEGSSLPVGGKSTHAVLSAHRGLPSARLFTDLDRLEIGDVFQITVLNRVLTYEVDQISVVKPDEVDQLAIEDGKDYCTLLTCTPYGVNTERLLVRGIRIETAEHKTIYITSDGYQIDTLIVTLLVALPMLVVLMLIVLFKPVQKEDLGDDLE